MRREKPVSAPYGMLYSVQYAYYSTVRIEGCTGYPGGFNSAYFFAGFRPDGLPESIQLFLLTGFLPDSIRPILLAGFRLDGLPDIRKKVGYPTRLAECSFFHRGYKPLVNFKR